MASMGKLGKVVVLSSCVRRLRERHNGCQCHPVTVPQPPFSKDFKLLYLVLTDFQGFYNYCT